MYAFTSQATFDLFDSSTLEGRRLAQFLIGIINRKLYLSNQERSLGWEPLMYGAIGNIANFPHVWLFFTVRPIYHVLGLSIIFRSGQDN